MHDGAAATVRFAKRKSDDGSAYKNVIQVHFWTLFLFMRI